VHAKVVTDLCLALGKAKHLEKAFSTEVGIFSTKTDRVTLHTSLAYRMFNTRTYKLLEYLIKKKNSNFSIYA